MIFLSSGYPINTIRRMHTVFYLCEKYPSRDYDVLLYIIQILTVTSRSLKIPPIVPP